MVFFTRELRFVDYKRDNVEKVRGQIIQSLNGLDENF